MTREPDPELLYRRWTHSHEEDAADATVFRPADYPFPPSRGRVSYELAPDGTLLEAGIGPTDRPTSEVGVWALEDDGRTLVLRTRGPNDGKLQVSVDMERDTSSRCELDADRPGQFAVEILTALSDSWGVDTGPGRERLWFVLEASG